MKKNLIYYFAVLLMAISSCSKDENVTEELPGQIPGMGETPGELQVDAAFVLPLNVELVGDINGSDNSLTSANIAYSLKSGGEDGDEGDHVDNEGEDHEGGSDTEHGEKCERGSGGKWISLDLSLINNGDTEKEIIFPAGCLFECTEDGYQHGIILQDVRIKIKGKGAIDVKLNLYCVNKGRPGSDIDLTYMIRGICSSKNMGHLMTKLDGKKIDILFFNDANMEEYKTLIEKIQEIVWSITNGIGVDEAGWNFIQSIQNIAD